MNQIMQRLNEELSHVLDKVVVMIGDQSTFYQVFGADTFISRYPNLFTSGLSLCQLPDTNFYIVENGKIVSDSSFFSVDEVNNHFFKAPLFDPQSFQPYQLRVVEEQQEVQTRLDKLRAFLSKDQPTSISNDDWNDLVEQEDAQSKYNVILIRRISKFK